jgi:hypothetical protein
VTPERWQEMKKVLAGALERTPTERRAYLDRACADASLRREVESVIAANEQGDTSFMEQPDIYPRDLIPVDQRPSLDYRPSPNNDVNSARDKNARPARRRKKRTQAKLKR